jgi:uncharacterized membrane protein
MLVDVLHRKRHGLAQFERPPHEGFNVGATERVLSAIGGALFMGFGAYRLVRGRWISGAASTLLGAVLTDRGARGHSELYQLIGTSTLKGAEPLEERSVQKTITIARGAHELYACWRRLDLLPQIMSHLDRVEVIDERRSHWVARVSGVELTWDAEIVENVPGEIISWRSVPGSKIEHSGNVRFTPAPGARGTEVRVQLSFVPPAGRIGLALARLLDDLAARKLNDDLRRFRQLMEVGEILTTRGQPLGAGSKKSALVEVRR